METRKVKIGYILDSNYTRPGSKIDKEMLFYALESVKKIENKYDFKLSSNVFSKFYVNSIQYSQVNFETSMNYEQIKHYVSDKLDIMKFHWNGNIYSLYITICDGYKKKHIALLDFIDPVYNKDIYNNALELIIDELNIFLEACKSDIYLQLNPLNKDGTRQLVEEKDCYEVRNNYNVIGVMVNDNIIGHMTFHIDRLFKYVHMDNGCVDNSNRGRSLSILARLPLILLGYRNPDLVELIGSSTYPIPDPKTKIYASRLLLQKYFGLYTHYPRHIINSFAKRIVSSSISKATTKVIGSRVGVGAGAFAGAGAEEVKNGDEDSDSDSDDDIDIDSNIKKDSIFKNNFMQNKKYALAIKNYMLSHNIFHSINKYVYDANTFLLIEGMDAKPIINTLRLFETCKKPK